MDNEFKKHSTFEFRTCYVTQKTIIRIKTKELQESVDKIVDLKLKHGGRYLSEQGEYIYYEIDTNKIGE